jgi:hypothetical protein
MAMRFAKNILMAAGALVLALMLLSVMAPKAVHAVAATMVQVVNTTSQPIPSQDISRLPSKNVQLNCNAIANACAIVEQNGTLDSTTPYKVPSGMDFIVTDVEISTTKLGSSPTTNFSLVWTPPSGTLMGFGWTVLNNGATAEYGFSNGIVILPGSTVTPEFGSNVNYAYVRGYLAPS